MTIRHLWLLPADKERGGKIHWTYDLFSWLTCRCRRPRDKRALFPLSRFTVLEEKGRSISVIVSAGKRRRKTRKDNHASATNLGILTVPVQCKKSSVTSIWQNAWDQKWHQVKPQKNYMAKRLMSKAGRWGAQEVVVGCFIIWHNSTVNAENVVPWNSVAKN